MGFLVRISKPAFAQRARPLGAISAIPPICTHAGIRVGALAHAMPTACNVARACRNRARTRSAAVATGTVVAFAVAGGEGLVARAHANGLVARPSPRAKDILFVAKHAVVGL